MVLLTNGDQALRVSGFDKFVSKIVGNNVNLTSKHLLNEKKNDELWEYVKYFKVITAKKNCLLNLPSPSCRLQLIYTQR